MKQFIHEKIDLGYDDLDADTTDSGRVYKAPDGSRYPSITTVLSLLSRDAIRAWRKRVGEAQANLISRRASTRGTKVHEIVEQYLDNEYDATKWTPDVIASLENLKPYLHRIDKIYEQECPLYSEHLGVAGRVDCVEGAAASGARGCAGMEFEMVLDVVLVVLLVLLVVLLRICWEAWGKV